MKNKVYAIVFLITLVLLPSCTAFKHGWESADFEKAGWLKYDKNCQSDICAHKRLEWTKNNYSSVHRFLRKYSLPDYIRFLDLRIIELAYLERSKIYTLNYDNNDLTVSVQNYTLRKSLPLYLFNEFQIASGKPPKTATPPSLVRDLPKLEEGFHWETFDEIAVAVPAPDNWFRAVSKAPGAFTGSISRENFNEHGLFKTGFTVQFFKNVMKKTGHPPSMLAVTMGEEIENQTYNEVISSAPINEMGPLRSCFIQYRNSPRLGFKITVHKFFVANDSKGHLYIYTFESPNEFWDEDFENYGSPMMERIVMTR